MSSNIFISLAVSNCALWCWTIFSKSFCLRLWSQIIKGCSVAIGSYYVHRVLQVGIFSYLLWFLHVFDFDKLYRFLWRVCFNACRINLLAIYSSISRCVWRAFSLISIFCPRLIFELWLCAIVSKYVQHIFPVGAKTFLRGDSPPWLRACGLPNITKSKHFLAYFIRFSKIRSCKPGCAPASPSAHLQCATACIWGDLSAAWFCSCKLLWRSDECVSFPCFNAHPVIFAVMNCCVVALSLFFPDSLTWSADSSSSVQRHI